MAKFTVDQWSDEGSNDESPYWIIWDEDGNSKKYVYDTVVGETLMYHNDIIAAHALEIERLRALVKDAYHEGWEDGTGGRVPEGVWSNWRAYGKPWHYSKARASLQSNDAITPLDNDTEEDIEARTRYWLHKNHCNVGEYEGSCKYGDDDCPELAKEK